jgi:hypothetical protein
MATHTVTATITVDVSNPSALNALGGGAQDEAAQVQAAVDAGLRELSSIAGRYGFTVRDATATVA